MLVQLFRMLIMLIETIYTRYLTTGAPAVAIFPMPKSFEKKDKEM